MRLLKILQVGVEFAEYYHKIKKIILYYSLVPYVVKDKIFETFTNNTPDQSNTKNPEK